MQLYFIETVNLISPLFLDDVMWFVKFPTTALRFESTGNHVHREDFISENSSPEQKDFIGNRYEQTSQMNYICFTV